MASRYATQYAKTKEAPPRRMDTVHSGVVQFKTDSFTFAADLAANDTIAFGKLPAGAKVYDVIATWTDMDDLDAAALDIGYTGAANAFHAAVDVASAAGSARFAATVGLVAISSEVEILVTVKTDTSATSGTISLTVLYLLD